MIGSIFFYIFAFLSIAGSLMVILPKNPIYSVVSLITTFLSVAALILLINAEFLAMTLIIVYVGAVAVLFLFVVMMLDINITSNKKHVFSLIGIIFGGILLFIICDSKEETLIKFATYNIANKITPFVGSTNNTSQLKQYNERGEMCSKIYMSEEQSSSGLTGKCYNTHLIGQVLYTDYFLHFQLSGLVLLVAMIGCITLTYNKRESKKIILDSSLQSAANVKMVKVGFNQGIEDIDYGNN